MKAMSNNRVQTAGFTPEQTPLIVLSDYARREAVRRYVIFVDGRVRGETADYDQAMHVQRLLRSHSRSNVIVEVRTANQATAR